MEALWTAPATRDLDSVGRRAVRAIESIDLWNGTMKSPLDGWMVVCLLLLKPDGVAKHYKQEDW